MSDFVLLFRATEADQRQAMGTPEAARQSMQAWSAWIGELQAGGHLKDPGRPLERAGKVLRGRNRMVTDGPYTEAKELVAGFIIVQADDLEQAVELRAAAPCCRARAAWSCAPSPTWRSDRDPTIAMEPAAGQSLRRVGRLRWVRSVAPKRVARSGEQILRSPP